MSIFKESQPKNVDDSLLFSSLVDTQGRDLKEHLTSLIEMYGLGEAYGKNQIGTLGTIYMYELFRTRTASEDKVVVYYPGIGGGDQSFDILGAFLSTNADEVYGVDLLDGREDIKDFHATASLAMERLPDGGDHTLLETDNEWILEFDLYEKRRKLTVSKVPTDITKDGVDGTGYVSSDPTIGPLVYSRGTATLLNHMSPHMNTRVNALMIRDDNNYTPREVQEFWIKQGLSAIDFAALRNVLMQKYELTGQFSPFNTRMLVRE